MLLEEGGGGGGLSHDVFRRTIYSDSPSFFAVYLSISVPSTTNNKITCNCKVTAVFSASSRRELTLIAGLAGEARVAFALIGSHAVSVLAARLTHSYSGRIQRGRNRSVQHPGRLLVPDQDDKALNPTAS